MTGQKFGRLEVIRLSSDKKWECICDCGSVVRVVWRSLVTSNTSSCGCLRRELRTRKNTTHNKSRTKVYKIWCGMIKRCYNQKSKSYKDYGGRGIEVCERWQEFENFYVDMGDPPKGYTIERRDNDKGYFLENCCWVTKSEQNNNQRTNHLIEFNGVIKNISQWEKYLGFPESTIHKRIFRNWSIERALTTPLRKRLS